MREDTAEDNVSTSHESRFALLIVVSSFVLAEMIDKTTLATLTLASDHDWAGVWIGQHPGHGRGRWSGDWCRDMAA
jgi:Ca2+/H+ antiporter, TMEM165/GDT1 family